MQYIITTHPHDTNARVLEKNMLPLRLDHLLVHVFQNEAFSREKLKQWIKAGYVQKNGCVCKQPSVKIVEGDVLVCSFPEQQTSLTPENGEVVVLYEDEDILLLNKPANIVVHPCASTPNNTLLQRLLWHFPELSSMGGERPAIVHRLDKDTTGLLLVARNEKTRLQLIQAFAERKVEKTYLALVHGIPQPYGCIEKNIGRDPVKKTRMAIVPHGKYAYTEYQTLFSYTNPDGFAYSLLHVKIATGRTHQIRVHLASLGHPLLGDTTYNTFVSKNFAPRCMLHAYSIAFQHPTTGKLLKKTLDPPEDFQNVFRTLPQHSLRCVLTGSACSGKSTAMQYFKERSVPVWSADEYVASLYRKGHPICDYLIHCFGNTIMDQEGNIDKKVLLSLMQEKSVVQKTIETVVHENVFQALLDFWKDHATYPYTVVEIPLYFEAYFNVQLSNVFVVFIDSHKDIRVQRMLQKHWNKQKIAYVLTHQWKDEVKKQLADYVLENNTSKTEFLSQLQQVEAILVEKIHTNNHRKSFTLSSLLQSL